MPTVQLRAEVNIELHELIAGLSQLETIEIQHIVSELNVILEQRKAETLPASQSVSNFFQDSPLAEAELDLTRDKSDI